MTKRIEVEVDGARASLVLIEEWAPKSTAALWESLPIEAPIKHGRLSGDVCFFSVKTGPMMQLPEQPELGESSIYKGFMCIAPKHDLGLVEIFISYGSAEYRGLEGRWYATPVAEVEGDGSALFDALKRTRTEGLKRVVVRRIEG